MSNRIFPLCGVAIRLATVSPPVCVCVCVCVSYSVILCCTAYMHRLTHRTNMFHPNRQVKAKGQIGIQPCWKVWLSLKLTLSVTHLLWTLTINRGDFVSLFLHPGHVTSRLHIHLYTVYNVKRPVNLTHLCLVWWWKPKEPQEIHAGTWRAWRLHTKRAQSTRKACWYFFSAVRRQC